MRGYRPRSVRASRRRSADETGRRKPAKHIRNCDPHVADARAATPLARLDGNDFPVVHGMNFSIIGGAAQQRFVMPYVTGARHEAMAAAGTRPPGHHRSEGVPLHILAPAPQNRASGEIPRYGFPQSEQYLPALPDHSSPRGSIPPLAERPRSNYLGFEPPTTESTNDPHHLPARPRQSRPRCRPPRDDARAGRAPTTASCSWNTASPKRWCSTTGG